MIARLEDRDLRVKEVVLLSFEEDCYGDKV